jgi:O-antigen ligase
MRTISYYLSLLLVFLLPIEGLFRIPGTGTTVKWIGLGVGLFWVATVFITKRVRRPSPLQIALAAFVLWNGLSVFWSTNPTRSGNHFFTWVQLLGMALMFWDLYTTRPAVLNALQMYVLGAYVAVGSAAQNYLAGRAFYTNYERFASGDTNPDGFGFILALGIPIAFYLASKQGGSSMSRLVRSINYVYIPVAFLGLALSGTRTALLASLVGLAFGLTTLTRVRLWVRIIILVLLVSSVLYLVPYVQSLKSFQRLGTTATELTQGDLNNRTNNWKEGLEAFKAHPILGVGANMYRTVNTWDKVAHNSFLSVLVELGLIGFILFAFILGIALTEAWRNKYLSERSFWTTLFIVWSMGAFTLTWEYRKTTWLFLSLMVANAAVSRLRQKRAARTSQPAAVPGNADGLNLPDPEALAG